MTYTPGPGPDLVIAGSARSGTSFLASVLGTHPRIDPCTVKEPNYFSREFARSTDWYDGLFRARQPDLLRLDASMSYTFTHFPHALDRLAETSPDAYVVYAVRHPVTRLLSHVQLHRDYFRSETARTLGSALLSSSVYAGASAYATWLPRLEDRFGTDRLLVVPFPVVTGRLDELLDVVCTAVGLAPEPLHQHRDSTGRHRNQVVEFKGRGVLLGRRAMRRSGLYPAVRRALGPDRLRRLRTWVTRPVETESLVEALATCEEEQHEQLAALHASAGAAVADFLVGQDARLGLAWTDDWLDECPLPGARGVDW
jgi:hypothetical protein